MRPQQRGGALLFNFQVPLPSPRVRQREGIPPCALRQRTLAWLPLLNFSNGRRPSLPLPATPECSRCRLSRGRRRTDAAGGPPLALQAG